MRKYEEKIGKFYILFKYTKKGEIQFYFHLFYQIENEKK